MIIGSTLIEEKPKAERKMSDDLTDFKILNIHFLIFLFFKTKKLKYSCFTVLICTVQWHDSVWVFIYESLKVNAQNI